MYKHFLKRLIDIVASFFVLLVLFFPLAVLAIVIALMTKSNPFFFQNRPGKNNKVFKMIKFKSMNNATDVHGNLLPDEQRLTKIGKFIRKTSLDELPELINILKGDMSIVGPRPLLVKYLPYYTDRELKRHKVRPGITGLSQISGRNHLNWDERLELDVQYVEKLSFMLDAKIVINTFFQVLKQKDVSVVSSLHMPDFDQYRKNNPKI